MLNSSDDEPMRLPKPMVCFDLLNELMSVNNRLLPERLLGHHTSRICRLKVLLCHCQIERLHTQPATRESVNYTSDTSKDPILQNNIWCLAAARKRGYIHNLPLVNGSPILPIPPKTIFGAFPLTKKWWPSWDPRWQFNCLQTCVTSAKLLEMIHLALTNCEDLPPVRVQKYVFSTGLVFAWTMTNLHHRDLNQARGK